MKQILTAQIPMMVVVLGILAVEDVAVVCTILITIMVLTMKLILTGI